MRPPAAVAALFLLLAATGCPADDDDDGNLPDATIGDTPLVVDTGPDTGTQMEMDAGDAGEGGDTGDGGDTGVQLMQSLTPGVGITLGVGTIAIGTDTFATVNAKLASATRTRNTGETTRSYEYALPDQITILTVWFANTNLDADDTPPNDVDDDDRVLWIAVEEGFAGTTPAGVGTDSVRTDVETAYGTAPNEVAIATPPGNLAQYYETGILVAYETNDDVRTITICRAYPTAPDGIIDVLSQRIVFDGTDELKAFGGVGDVGTEQSGVRALLGEPDAEGPVTLNGTMLDTLSYGFIGLEVFFTSISTRTFFITVHAPFYGGAGTVGIGSTKADMQTYLSGEGYTESPSSNAQFFCYDQNNEPSVGVTYTAGDLVSSITLALPACP